MSSFDTSEQVSVLEERVEEMVDQLRMAGTAGLELVNANEQLNEHILHLEETNTQEKNLNLLLRDEVKQLQHEQKRKLAGYKRIQLQLESADEERDRLQHILSEQAHHHHIALDSATRHLQEARVDVTFDKQTAAGGEGGGGEGGRQAAETSTGSTRHTRSSIPILKQASTNAADHVSMTLNAAMTGLSAETVRHEKLLSKWRKGLVHQSEWKHHEQEHHAAVSRWRQVAKMAQQTR